MRHDGITFGDDASMWSNDGECDDPRFAGPGMTATTLLDADAFHDATDCLTAYRNGRLRLTDVVAGGMRFDGVNFGDDASRWARDDECDDPRFFGAGMTSTVLLDSDVMHDASDCMAAFRVGRLQLDPSYFGDGAVFEGLNFGDDASDWSRDDECDDPRFSGPGMTATVLLDADILHDATDCLAAYRAGDLTYVGAGRFSPETESELSVSTGSAFFVSSSGHLVTNAHVVEECSIADVSNDSFAGQATVIARDNLNDVAVLKVEVDESVPLTFRKQRPELGESVVVFGYPLSGTLTESLQVTTGIVSAQRGLGEDIRFVQITAPVQPGNSGGPLLDESGHVIGVVTSKIDALAIASETGTMPENINFALKSDIARVVLGSVDVTTVAGVAGPPVKVRDLARNVRASVAQVTCRSDM